MTTPAEEWFSLLNQHIEQCRLENPLPSREELTKVQETQCRIVGGAIIAWLERYGPQFLQERQVLHKVMGVDAEPSVVLTSNVPGLVAANEILDHNHENIAILFREEFQHWLSEHPDENYKWHVHFWSFFQDSVEREYLKRAKEEYPLPPSTVYWQHTEGTMWGRLVGRGVEHLWAWDGETPQLLEEAFGSWVS